MIERQDALNDALARLEGTVAFTMEPGFSEHAPMVAEAMSCLGMNERIADWVEDCKRRHRHIPPPPPREPIDASSEAAWRSALGDAARTTDWFEFFRRELRERPWQEVVRVWVPRLIDGYGGGLTHGLIRTAHAVRALPEGALPSALQRNELARGLGYWAGAYLRQPGDTDRHGGRSLAAALRALPRGGGLAARPPAIRAPVPDQAAFAAAVESLEPTGDVGAAVSRHTATFARVLLAHAELPMVPQIQLVHTITSAAALRTLLPLCPPEFAPKAYRRAWQVAASIVARLAQASEAETDPEMPDPLPTAAELAERAVEHRDDHVIKLTEACLREDRIAPDPVYRAAASAIQRRIPPWSAGRGRPQAARQPQ